MPTENTAIADGQPGPEGLRRRSARHVVRYSLYILATVWIVHYRMEASEAFRIAAEDGLGQPWSQILDSLFIAKICPPALMSVLAAVVGILGQPWSQILDPLFIAKSCPHALMSVLAAVVGIYLFLRLKSVQPLERLILQALNEPRSDGENRPARSWKWIVLGLATMVTALTILEWIEPFYFVQDDSFSGVLPLILQGCRSIFQGEFPGFNPCQLMGSSSVGGGLLFYPPTIASYAIARWGLGNENFTLDVFAWMHLLLGFLASFAAARTAGLRPASAFALGISFTLSGYVLLIGRGWCFVVAAVVWIPLLFCLMENWLNGRAGWRWLLAAGLTIGGFYYIGFPQYWFYGMLLLGCTAAIAVIGGRVAARQLIWPIAAALLGVALLLPTLVVQLELTRGMTEKAANFGSGFEKGLMATIAPFPFSHAEGFMGLPANRDPALETEWYYAGTFLMACGFFSMGSMLAYRCRRSWLGQNPWTATAILALWLGLGTEGLLWAAIGSLWVSSLNHHPHRLMPFFVFFALIVGGIFLERLLRRSNSRKWEYGIAAATALLMLYHVSLARNGLWCYGDRPYPALPQKIAERVLPSQNPLAGRVWWRGPILSGLPGFAYMMPRNLPSAYGAYGYSGYDPIFEARPETQAYRDKMEATPAEAARAYGIRWILVGNAEYYKKDADYWSTMRASRFVGFNDTTWPSYREKSLRTAVLLFSREEVSLYELPDASPLAFDRASPRTPLPIAFHGWGAEVQVPGTGDRKVVVNIIVRPWLRAVCGKQSLESSTDEWGRMEVLVPDGITDFQVFYDLPWRRGILMAAGLILATFGGVALVRKRI